MLYREIIAVCSEIHTKHINIVWAERRIFFSVKPGGINYPVGFGTLWLPLGTMCRRDTVQTAKPVPSTRYNQQHCTSASIDRMWQVTGNRRSLRLFYGTKSKEICFKQFVSSNVKL